MFKMRKTEPKYKSLLLSASNLDGSQFYTWVLVAVLLIISVSFALIAFSFEHIYAQHHDFEPLDPTIIEYRLHNPVNSLFSPKRASYYSEASRMSLKSNVSNSYKKWSNQIKFEDHIVEPNTEDTTSTNTKNILLKDNANLFCYYSLPNRYDDRFLLPSAIDAKLCTHILLAFAMVSENCTLVHPEPSHLQFYSQVLALKEQNPDLKVLISVTDAETGHFAKTVATRETRNAFVKSTLEFLQYHKLDGVDLDWEFPGWPKGQHKTEEKRWFRKLLQEMRFTLKNDFLLTVAAAAPWSIIDGAYDIPSMGRLVDFVSIMAYDYHSYIWYYPILGPNAPLYSSKSDKGYFQTMNSNWSVNYYLQRGMPANKLLLGVPTYGHSFTLVNPDSTDYGMPAAGPGRIGNGGFVDYFDIMSFLQKSETVQIFDRDTRVPYAYNADQWISFENEQSLAYKTEYIMSKKLSGAMVWCLNTDDFSGKYHKTPFPLTKRIKTVLADDGL